MKKFFKSENGQGLVEYGLLLSFVAIVAIGSLSFLGSGLNDRFGAFSDALVIAEEEEAYVVTSADGFKTLTALGRLSGSYSGDETRISIPLTMDGFNIKAIYQDVFKGKGLTEVNFGEGNIITQIHARAFQGNELTSIVLPSKLNSIDTLAFQGNKLTTVTLPSTLTKIEWKAFDGNNITRVTIGSNVSSIGTGAFSNNNEGFKSAYAAGGAGTYVYTNGAWVKQ